MSFLKRLILLFKKSPLIQAHKILIARYKDIFDIQRRTVNSEIWKDSVTNQGSPESRPESLKIYSMILALEDLVEIFPDDKTSRWLGYIQRYLIEKELTTVNEEGEFSRILFHKAYKEMGYNIPKTVEIK